jgi:hypothetical protein
MGSAQHKNKRPTVVVYGYYGYQKVDLEKLKLRGTRRHRILGDPCDELCMKKYGTNSCQKKK